MRRAAFLLFVVVILIGGGLLSNAISQGGGTISTPILSQTSNPEASASVLTPNKGAWFLIISAVILGSVGGFGATIAVAIWLLNRWTRRAAAQPDTAFEYTLDASSPNSIGGALTHRPAITISVVIVLIMGLGVVAAIVFGAFSK